MRKIIGILFLLFLAPSVGVLAQEAQLINDKQEVVLARVLNVLEQEERNIPGTDTPTTYQTIEVEILEGELEGEVVMIENDYLSLEKGEKFYVLHTVDWESGKSYFAVQDKYRLPALLFLVLFFLLVVVIFGGIQGVRGLLSLIGSLLLIIFVLLPGIIKGFSPVFLTIAVSSVIIVVGSYVTHGFNKTTSSAVIGMILTVLITGLLAHFVVDLTALSGYESEEAIYLTFNSGGQIDILGLLFGGIMIGLLGALYDAAIGQAVAVDELVKIAPHVKARKIYERAMRMGREHIGALVDTLAIAYVGAALPLLLLFYQSSAEHYLTTLNREIFVTEIVRTLIGSIGLILAVPVTTFIAVRMLKKDNPKIAEAEILHEEERLDTHTHSHHH